MPNRIIRDGFLDSESVDSLTPHSEVLYHRLLLGADDAGRFDGRAKLIAARLFPLKNNLRASDVEKWLSECLQAGLAFKYERNGNSFLQLTKWQRCGKAETSKYPDINGSYKIEYVSKETRDGVKDFVTSSIPHDHPMPTPCAPHINGVTPNSNTETETEAKTKTETEACSGGKNDASASTRHASWGKWTEDQFKAEAWQANATMKNGLPEEEFSKFVKHWLSPSKTGIPAFKLQKTWDTTLRLGNWKARIKEKSGQSSLAIGQKHEEPDLPNWRKV